MAEIHYAATGKRKSAIARIILKEGTGNIYVNQKTVDEYFPMDKLKMILRQPLNAVSATGKYDISVRIKGGGLSGQAGAIKHGIARALVLNNPDYRKRLKKEGLLTRDPRTKERKKYGQKGARKRFQYSKR